MFPNQVQLGLHVTDIGRNGNHRILFGQDQYILAIGTVGPVSIVTATPQLIAIALQPVAVFVVRPAFFTIWGDMPAGNDST